MDKMGNKKACGIGLFNCLPDDVLMSTLNRIHDLKSLFRCTLVSKGFAKNIYRVKSISLKLPAFDMNSTEASSNIFHLSRDRLDAELQKISKFCPPTPPRAKLKFTTFLKKFTELECASFEFACPKTPCSSPSLKWKAKLGNSGPAIEMLVSVLPKALVEVAESESEEEVEEEDNEEEGEEDEEDEDEEDEEEVVTIHQSPTLYLAKGCLLFSLMSFAEWFGLIFSLIKNHDALKGVICTDSGKHGKIVLDAEQIVEWRKRLMCGKLSHNAIPRNIAVGCVLSSSPGYPMKRSLFVIMNFISSPGTNRDILKSLEFDQEEKVVAEAVKGMLARPHSSSFYIIRR